MYGSLLDHRARVAAVLSHHEFSDDVDEEPLGWQERREQASRRLGIVCAARVVGVHQLSDAPREFFEAHEMLAMVSELCGTGAAPLRFSRRRIRFAYFAQLFGCMRGVYV